MVVTERSNKKRVNLYNYSNINSQPGFALSGNRKQNLQIFYLMNSKKTISLAAFIASILYLASCKHDPELAPGTAEVCFERDIMLIVNSNCNVDGCHGSGDHEMPDLNTYDDIYNLVDPGKPSKSKFYEVVTANPGSEKFMPPRPKPALTKEQLDMISIWFMQGATNEPCH